MNHLRRLWRRYGPTFGWNTFRLHGEPPNGRWMPLKVTQVFGGRTWSLAIIRQGRPREPDPSDLHGDWRFLTSKMTTDEKNAFADAADRYGATLDPDEPGTGVDRWWREDR